MSNVLEQLVQKVAYMFYDAEKTMVLIGLLEIGRQVNLDELSTILKFRKRDLSKTLGVLEQDCLIRRDPQEDLEGVEDYDSLTKSQKDKLVKDYYSIDFKSFVDSIHLKILYARERLRKEKGPEDLIFYQCPKCKAMTSYVDYIANCSEYLDKGIICPECNEPLQVLDDSEEINEKKKMYKDFVELTDPLLNLIRQTDGLVMINDAEELCKSDKMIPRAEYEEKKKRIQREIEIRRSTYSKSGPSGMSNIRMNPLKTEIHVISEKDEMQKLSAQMDETVDKYKDLIAQQEKVDLSKDESQKATININGKEYTVDELTDEFLDSLDPDSYNKAMSFIEANQ